MKCPGLSFGRDIEGCKRQGKIGGTRSLSARRRAGGQVRNDIGPSNLHRIGRNDPRIFLLVSAVRGLKPNLLYGFGGEDAREKRMNVSCF